MRIAAAVTTAAVTTIASAVIATAPAIADTGGAAFGSAPANPAPATQTTTGGVDPSAPVTTPQPRPGDVAALGDDGLAVAPAGAPDVVRQIVAAGNAIARKPYLWGGGHRRWLARGYDCSGSVSYALHGAGLLDAPLVSGDFAGWGAAGPGSWVTIYANAGHVFMVVAGLRFDTSGRRQGGSRWQAAPRRVRGFKVRHPVGL